MARFTFGCSIFSKSCIDKTSDFRRVGYKFIKRTQFSYLSKSRFDTQSVTPRHYHSDTNDHVATPQLQLLNRRSIQLPFARRVNHRLSQGFAPLRTRPFHTQQRISCNAVLATKGLHNETRWLNIVSLLVSQPRHIQPAFRFQVRFSSVARSFPRRQHGFPAPSLITMVSLKSELLRRYIASRVSRSPWNAPVLVHDQRRVCPRAE